MQQTSGIGGDNFTLKHFCIIFVLVFVFFSSGLCDVCCSSDRKCGEILTESSVYGDVSITIEPHVAFPQSRYYGYIEHIISLSNNSTKPHIVTLAGPAISYGSGDNIRRISRTVELLPSSQTKVSFLQPPATVSGSNLEVIIDGRQQDKNLKMDYCRMEYVFYYGGVEHHSFQQQRFSILLSCNVSYDGFKNNNLTTDIETKAPQKDLPKRPGQYEFLSSNTLVQEWSKNWLAYTSYDGIVVTANDMNSMPDAVLTAILKYVRCGGALLVIGKWDGVEKWTDKQESLGQLQLNYIHFGVCAVSDGNDIEKWQEQTWQTVRSNLWEPVGREITRPRSIAKANDEFGVADSLVVPVRGLFLLVLVFAIVIGPTNLWILGRMQKRIWMLWTVPFIAIITSAAVFFYAVYTEGLDSHARTCAITILDGKTHTATTIGVSAFYCPLTPRDGLHYDYQTELTPLGLKQWGGGRARYVEWTNDQHFSAGWIIGRVPAHFLIRKSQPVAEPVKITKDAQNQLIVHNNIGVEISRFLYADKQGNIHSAENIKSAGQEKLTPTQQSIGNSSKLNHWREIYTSSWAAGYKAISAEPEKYLKPGTAIALLNGAAFVEDALSAAKTKNFESVVICLMEGGADEG